ncbi:MAG: hypothetical protein EBZ89_15605, partial [Chloroflexi bacterium]|nr:hypothetical protein [Chloroflexota bacterium]
MNARQVGYYVALALIWGVSFTLIVRVVAVFGWVGAVSLRAFAACVILGHWLFGITWWMGILAVLVTFFLSIVAARATGETDIT